MKYDDLIYTWRLKMNESLIQYNRHCSREGGSTGIIENFGSLLFKTLFHFLIEFHVHIIKTVWLCKRNENPNLFQSSACILLYWLFGCAYGTKSAANNTKSGRKRKMLFNKILCHLELSFTYLRQTRWKQSMNWAFEWETKEKKVQYDWG